MSTVEAHLRELAQAATSDLPEVTWKRMFGCQVVFARGRGFGLIWKGRIGLKLPDEAAFQELLAHPETGRWTMTKRTAVSHWLLLPEAFHDDEDQLRAWSHRAYQVVLAADAAAPPKRTRVAQAKKRAPATQRSPAPKSRR